MRSAGFLFDYLRRREPFYRGGQMTLIHIVTHSPSSRANGCPLVCARSVLQTSTWTHAICLAPVLLAALLAGTQIASAAVITGSPSLFGPVGLSDIAPPLTTADNNDNDGSPINPPNRAELLELQFTGTGSIDVVFPIANSGGTTEYALGLGTSLGFISTSIINSSGASWSGMQIVLGSGIGGSFTPTSVGSGLDFDIPHGDPLPASDVFGFFQNWGNKMNFVGGLVPSGVPEDFAAHFIMTANMDLPDGLGSEFTLRLTPLLAEDLGETQDNPVMPSSIVSGVAIFSGATRDRWFDPPTADGFLIEMLEDGELFTGINDFPTGFLDEFEVFVGSTSLGMFGPGDSLIFPGSGVSSFEIRGINPLFDPNNLAAFPIRLDFNVEEGADFSMTALEAAAAVPEPATLTLTVIGLGLAGLVLRSRRLAK